MGVAYFCILQEHKLHLQMSSHEQFLSLVRQLEEKCTTLSQQVTEVNEHLDLLSNNGTAVIFRIILFLVVQLMRR